MKAFCFQKTFFKIKIVKGMSTQCNWGSEAGFEGAT